jgi:hypothetical protein
MALRSTRIRPIHSPSPSRARLRLQPLEGRNLPTVGGGYTGGGILGEYFANPDLAGDPSFTRRDVRIDFNFDGQAPGGSTSPDFEAVGAQNFSVRWTGDVIPRFSQTYTFEATGNDGVRLYIRPAGTSSWTLLVDDWNAPTNGEDDATYFMTKGRTYDVRLEYREVDGPGVARLAWSSPSTPEEVIEPGTDLGVNAITYDNYLFADAAKTGRPNWGDPVDFFGGPAVATDALDWPLADAGHLFWSNADPTKTGGTYLLQFQGQAQVSGMMGQGEFWVNGVDEGQTLPLGAGYNPASNTTTAEVVVPGTDLFGLNFVDTQRDPSSPIDSGITNVQLMRPTAANGSTPYQPGELFDADVKQALTRFTTLRFLTANFNNEQNWSDRELPGAMQAAFGDQHAVWEDEVMLANETGKDLYITVPVLANPDYIEKLADLIRYGSDGVNPYTSPVANPVYPGLNSNLRVYVEWGNEWWNWAFAQAGWAADADVAAVQAGTPEGQIINFDGQRPGGDFRRWAALHTVETSDTFRSVFGDAAMGNQVRVLFEYQYDNQQFTAVQGLQFIDEYFNNGEGNQHVADPHPISYYIWGAGGAAYFGASNPLGFVTGVTVPGGTFDSTAIPTPGTAVQDPTGTPWTYSGTAGVYRDQPGVAANTPINIAGIGPLPTTSNGTRAMYVSGTGSASVTINFPRAGTFAVDFLAAAEAGPGMGNTLDFYLANQRVTPNGADSNPPPYPWWPGNGDRNSSVFSQYGTVPVQITKPGKYTFQIVGRGTADQTTVIDSLRVSSLDAIFNSRIPTGVQAAGAVTKASFLSQVATEAKYALAYGLNVVAYEGGWSLGGDQVSVPLQSWAKYTDPRTERLMASAITGFFQAGGAMFALGTYDQWYLDDSANAENYPIVQAIDNTLSALPPTANFGLPVPGTAPVSLQPAKSIQALTYPPDAAPGDWMSWNVQIPVAGTYQLTSRTASGGTVSIYVDGSLVAQGSSSAPVQAELKLSAGLHTIREQDSGGWYLVLGATIDRIGP